MNVELRPDGRPDAARLARRRVAAPNHYARPSAGRATRVEIADGATLARSQFLPIDVGQNDIARWLPRRFR